ncbi:class F sortase [Nocardioides terrisoli]|uniref:class F sortase n=1 Tax=Nocardioides terrisoli TaxID=3388267 RepID=UPI00287BB59E|nr:class F sortase [Nocardioides marmorisolisilvae]
MRPQVWATLRSRAMALTAPRWGRRNWSAVAAAAAVIAVLSLVWQLSSEPEPAHASRNRLAHVAPQQVLPGQTLRADFCGQPAAGPFVPTSITIPGITRDSAVIALPRDANNIPSPLPLTDAAKHEFAWDEQPSPMPGAKKGNVILNTHTWPWFSTPAMGNLLLEHLHRGDRIIVRGKDTHLCYQVTRKVSIWADQPYPAYYVTDGRPQLAIMVCSGTRVGPGDWDHRTAWFASPMA